jgi:hypothetical protein
LFALRSEVINTYLDSVCTRMDMQCAIPCWTCYNMTVLVAFTCSDSVYDRSRCFFYSFGPVGVSHQESLAMYTGCHSSCQSNIHAVTKLSTVDLQVTSPPSNYCSSDLVHHHACLPERMLGGVLSSDAVAIHVNSSVCTMGTCLRQSIIICAFRGRPSAVWPRRCLHPCRAPAS